MRRKKKHSLTLYLSKRAKIRKKYEIRWKRLGRPNIRKKPLKTKDLDETVAYEWLTTDTCSDEEEAMVVNFNLNVQAEDPSVTTCAAAAGNSPPSSPQPSSSGNSLSSSTSISDSEEEDDMWNRPYVQYCLEELKSDELLKKLVENLYETDCLPDFMSLMTQLSDGSLSPLNIAFLLALERARWQSLKTTTQMRFRPVTKKFWLVVYRLLKGKGLRFFSGPKNYGQVISNKASKGLYDPKESEINFAVPDERHLRNQDRQLGRIIQPGPIKESLKLVRGHDDIILMGDCKRVSKGLKFDKMGDVNLWGHENPPTLQQRNNTLYEECTYVTHKMQSLPDDEIFQVHIDLKYLLQLLTTKIRDVRNIELQERRRMIKYQKCNPDPNYKASAKGACRAHIYECKTFITEALLMNQTICKNMSYLQQTISAFNSSPINLEDQVNVRRLLPTRYVSRYTTVEHHPEWFKQLSTEWKDVRAKAHITGSTAYNAMGFRGFPQVRNHFRQYIYKKTPAPVDAATQARMEHGRQHEVSDYLFVKFLTTVSQ